MFKEKLIDFGYKWANKPWKRVCYNTALSYYEKEVHRSASSLAYYFIFAIFPCLIFISSFLIFLNVSDLLNSNIMFEPITALIPTDVLNLIDDTLFHMQKNYSNNWFTFSLLFSMWFVWRAISYLITSLNKIFNGDDNIRKGLAVAILGIILILLIPIYTIAILISSNFLDFVNNFIPINNSIIDFWGLIRFVPLSIATFISYYTMYVISSRRRIPKKFLYPGAFLGTLIWIIFSMGFIYYVDQLGRYSLLYGSIGTVIALLVWLDVSIISLLFGALFNQALVDEFQ